jgi:hypothetical protein
MTRVKIKSEKYGRHFVLRLIGGRYCPSIWQKVVLLVGVISKFVP